MSMREVSVRQEGDRVLIIENGRLVLDMPWQAGLQFAKAMHQKSKLAEEHANAGRIITDNALLIRAGIPLGLTNRQDMIRESIRVAEHDRDLRRYLPGGIRSKEVFGTPRVFHKREPIGLLTAGKGPSENG